MKFFSSSYIIPVSTIPIKNGIVVIGENNQIIDVFDPNHADSDQESILRSPDLQIFEGFIIPGFVNTHCHLELSHLKGKIESGGGLDQFIRNLDFHRKADIEEVLFAQMMAENEMIENGIVAVGDISNGRSSFQQKSNGKIHYHTFLEIFAFKEALAETAFNRALQLYEELNFLQKNHPSEFYNTASISPHAPYSTSTKLLKLISSHAEKNNSFLSIHNQENMDENIFFKEKKGKIVDRLTHFGVDINDWQPTGMNSLQSTARYLPVNSKILLVHNTVTTKTDRLWAENYSNLIYWCFCPGANLYIENILPDFDIFKDAENCTLGTDSLASNTELSILEEMKYILKASTKFSFEEILRFATINGARFLGFEKLLGSIERGKKPGLNLLSSVDIINLSIGEETKVENLLK